jgi:hypothetical protein
MLESKIFGTLNKYILAKQAEPIKEARCWPKALDGV